MPGKGEYPYFCDDCVPRGCSCNHEMTPEHKDAVFDGLNVGRKPEGNYKFVAENVWVHLDEKGREEPCCEYSYDKEGWEAMEDEINDYKTKGIEYYVK